MLENTVALKGQDDAALLEEVDALNQTICPPVIAKTCHCHCCQPVWMGSPCQSLVPNKAKVGIQGQCACVGDLGLQDNLVSIAGNHAFYGHLHELGPCMYAVGSHGLTGFT